MPAVAAGRHVRAAPGEEAVLLPGGAEIRSGGALPLRSRSEAQHHGRPAFPGTAVTIDGALYEVVSQRGGDGPGVVYSLRPWPDGEIARERASWDPGFVAIVLAGRERERRLARVRPWRPLLNPLVGALPEGLQQRVCERLGLDSVQATLVSGLCESTLVFTVTLVALRRSDTGAAIALVSALPGIVLCVLPGLGRAFGARFLRETAGSAPVVLAFRVAEALGRRPALPSGFVPLTRAAFWQRLATPDAVERRADGTLVHRGLLPHLGWGPGRHLLAGDDWWGVTPLEPALDGDHLVYAYEVSPLGDPRAADEPARREPGGLAYAEQVLGEVRRDWDALNEGFAWLTSMLAARVQARAFDHRGGPPAARRATLWTALGTAALGAYLLSFLPGPEGDPLAPVVALLGLAALTDAAIRGLQARRGRYAPSLFRAVLPSDWLRPERRPFHEHRDAESRALATSTAEAAAGRRTP
jgi:hypothetical protein